MQTQTLKKKKSGDSDVLLKSPKEINKKIIVPADLLHQAQQAAEKAKAFSYSVQNEDGHWCAELESNSTITAEYVFLMQLLGKDLDARKEKLQKYFFHHQKKDGSWGIASNHAGDLSTTAEVYLALTIIGVEISDSRMKSAEKYIRAHGGLEKVRIFTRINFAMFGLFPWDSVPVIPPEFILVPPQSPVNIYRLSSWARGTMVPLFIIFHHKPVYALPNGKSANNDWLDHLWLDPSNKKIPYSDPWQAILKKNKLSWRSFFTLGDQFLKFYEPRKIKLLRNYAVKKCEEWVLEHQEKSGDWAGIFPPMLNGVIALTLNGYALDSDPVRLGLQAIENFGVDDDVEGFRVQACVSPVWDTILLMIGILDCSSDDHEAAAMRLDTARDWISSKQILDDHGDWKVYNPKGKSGGWSFEYENTWYPDVDDTAAIIIGFLKQYPNSGDTPVVRRAVEWTVSMQNRDGGWAAFDINNDKVYLNQIPFSDMDSLCDPSSPDVTGRVLEALGLLNDPLYEKACERGIEYLRNTQEKEGSWFGRWGVNYVYGTSNVLCSLSRNKILASDPMIVRGLKWLKSVQNVDGGWGECLESYSDKKLMGKGSSTPSQTAWGLMGLLAYLPANDPAIEKGIRWLINHQVKASSAEISILTGPKDKKLDEMNDSDGATWNEREFTGTGFPNHFYLRYHMYRHYFPMMALGRYCAKAKE